MLTDYKFWYIRRDDDGFITDCAVRFYEGEISAKKEYGIFPNKKLVIRYRRIRKLKREDLSHLRDRFIKDSKGKDAKLYTQQDFGKIKTDDELRSFLNKELVKDTKRIPIQEQKWLP